MQFAFDCGNDARPRSGYDGNDCEFGAAFGRSPWCWQAVAGLESGDVAGRLETAVTRDGVANYFAALSPGLSPFKNPSLFRRIRLTE